MGENNLWFYYNDNNDIIYYRNLLELCLENFINLNVQINIIQNSRAKAWKTLLLF